MEEKTFKGLIQIYTGDGKGKTTSALGQGFRAVGYGYNVLMIQFLKGMDSGEIYTASKLGTNFIIKRFDRSKKFFWNMNESEREDLKGKIKKAFDYIKEVIEKRNADILILDEIMGVLSNELISENELIEILKNKPENMEIILTGRDVPEKLLEIADLVTEMKMIKHPFQKGIYARKGIEY